MIAGKLEVTIKINELPQAQTVENNWQQFEIDCNGRIITVTVKPNIWKKLTEVANSYPQWIEAISGKLSQLIQQGFVLTDPIFKFPSASPRRRQQLHLGQLEKNPKSIGQINSCMKLEVTQRNNQNLTRCEKKQSSVRSSLSMYNPNNGGKSSYIKM
ncbi:hypothetical protein [Nostoc sp. FACHB-145]|uniref:hypothetical protein n=1 Tax=Nostoc sp. FACHB-145 TaxID=2692836 RepID=UPI0018EFD10A|nr:hypothetical protein [Nostoc sp. FACHB-145]